MTFRPFLWLTVVALPALLVLVGLGTWQELGFRQQFQPEFAGC